MIQTKDIENPSTKNITANFPNLGKYMDIQAQEAFRTPNRHDQKRISPCHIIVKMPIIQRRNIEDCNKISKLVSKTNLSELQQTFQQKSYNPGKHEMIYFKTRE
jgi:hypothetical protein